MNIMLWVDEWHWWQTKYIKLVNKKLWEGIWWYQQLLTRSIVDLLQLYESWIVFWKIIFQGLRILNSIFKRFSYFIVINSNNLLIEIYVCIQNFWRKLIIFFFSYSNMSFIVDQLYPSRVEPANDFSQFIYWRDPITPLEDLPEI